MQARALALLLVSVAAISSVPAGDELQVMAVEPAARSIGASIHTPIVVRFDRPVDRGSITAGSRLWAFGRWSGPVAGTYTFHDGDRAVSLIPHEPLSSGESVMVFLSQDVRGADLAPLQQGGYSFQFWTRAQPAAMNFTEIDRMTTRTEPFETSRAYGGIASDLDGDRFLDITIVNEDTADLRVFMNKADQTALYHPFIQPTFPVGNQASPSEPADFNRDGIVDICTANIADDTVSILLGNGDGTFGPQQTVSVGDQPRGIAVLDADGDGDVDIVNTNSGNPTATNMSVMFNDGTGVFGPATFFPGGAVGAWALGAADMDEDGRLDLVIGASVAERMIVQRGVGDGSFQPVSSQPSGGAVWMLVPGDVNADGHEDISGVNSSNSNGAIFLGDGQGGLTPPQTYGTDAFPLATDLGDLDGDGDLDWITSSFSGDWRVFLNDGNGAFSFHMEFPSAIAASCSLILDMDNDGDMDVALIDELEDEVILMRNGAWDPPGPPPDAPTIRVGKLDPAAAGLSLVWEEPPCTGFQWHVLYGDTLPTSGDPYALDGARCAVGAAQPFHWLTSPVAADLLWFLLVSDDGQGNEGAWGVDGQGIERLGPGPNGASLECDVLDKQLDVDCAP